MGTPGTRPLLDQSRMFQMVPDRKAGSTLATPPLEALAAPPPAQAQKTVSAGALSGDVQLAGCVAGVSCFVLSSAELGTER